MKKQWQILLNGIFRENPVLILLLGCCSTLAISVTVLGSLGMGAALTFVKAGYIILNNLLPKLELHYINCGRISNPPELKLVLCVKASTSY